jgi:hypothetical protein
MTTLLSDVRARFCERPPLLCYNQTYDTPDGPARVVFFDGTRAVLVTITIQRFPAEKLTATSAGASVIAELAFNGRGAARS